MGRIRSVFDVRYLALLSSLATYALIVLGGTVRATDSGLACPDWPLCHGQIIPPLETNILIEYSHRLAAASVSLLIVGTAIAAWLWYRDNGFVLAGAGAAVGLLIAQVLIGAVTVNLELPDTIVALHLSIALMILAILIAVTVGAVWWQRPATSAAAGGPVMGRGVTELGFVAALATFALILVGSYVANSGAGLVYSDWPLFNGKVISSGGRLADLHYAHRLLAAVVGVLVVALAVRIWRQRQPVLVAAIAFAIAAYVAEVLVGAINVWLELPASTRIIHLALASAVWSAVVFTLVWDYAEASSARLEAA